MNKKQKVLLAIIILIPIFVLIIWLILRRREQLSCLPPTCIDKNTVYPLSFPTNDPFNIGEKVKIHQKKLGYFMIIGDWGAGPRYATGRPAERVNFCLQKLVAQKMKDYAATYGPPLFILSCGDNFYLYGLVGEKEEKPSSQYDPGLGIRAQWYDIYSDKDTSRDLTSVPWLLTLGNHDWGSASPYALCPWKDKKNRTLSNGFYHSQNQLNKSKGGYRPSSIPNVNNLYLPDYSYYYAIPELDLEIICLETNFGACPSQTPGWTPYGKEAVDHNCGTTSDEICLWLEVQYNAAIKLLKDRAKNTKAHNIIINQHYPEILVGGPSLAAQLLEIFSKAAGDSKMKNIDIRAVFGHAHATLCRDASYRKPHFGKTKTNKNQCQYILAGGGGGCCGATCCSSKDTCTDLQNYPKQPPQPPVPAGKIGNPLLGFSGAGPAGFVAMHFTKDGDNISMNNSEMINEPIVTNNQRLPGYLQAEGWKPLNPTQTNTADYICSMFKNNKVVNCSVADTVCSPPKNTCKSKTKTMIPMSKLLSVLDAEHE